MSAPKKRCIECNRPMGGGAKHDRCTKCRNRPAVKDHRQMAMRWRQEAQTFLQEMDCGSFHELGQLVDGLQRKLEEARAARDAYKRDAKRAQRELEKVRADSRAQVRQGLEFPQERSQAQDNTDPVEQWMQQHTFYCPTLRARISPEQCQRNREQAVASWGDSGKKHSAPPQCARCTRWEEYQAGLKEAV